MSEKHNFRSKVIPAAATGLILTILMGERLVRSEEADVCANNLELIGDEETKTELKTVIMQHYDVDVLGVEFTQNGDKYVQVLDGSQNVYNVWLVRDQTTDRWTAFAADSPCPPATQ